MFRSTKGASKQRRNLINAEICALRDLLPISDCSRQRLSQLQVMCLTCVYIRKCHYFDTMFTNKVSDHKCTFNFFQAMPGFLMVVARDGKLLYVSENVTEHLGHSMMDMITQGDSVYDIIDTRDHDKVRSNLSNFNPGYRSSGIGDDGCATTDAMTSRGTPRDDRVFFCRMNIARSCRRQTGPTEHKTMHIRGHFVYPVPSEHHLVQPIFVAICCPLVSPDIKDSIIHLNTMIFYSVHHLDMKYLEISHNGQFHLGYTEEELVDKSWYELLHPQDLNEAVSKHMQLVKSSQEIGCTVIVRMQTKSGAWIWINTFMSIRQSYASSDSGDPVIVCVNHVIFESEAFQFKLENQFLSMYVASSPEYLSQRTSILPQVITKESTGCGDPIQYEPNAIPWRVATTTTTTPPVDGAFAMDNRVPAYSPTIGRGLATTDDRPSYCHVEDFPQYSPQPPPHPPPPSQSTAPEYCRLEGMSGSLLDQLMSVRSTENPCSIRSNDIISRGRCPSCVDLSLDSTPLSSKDRGGSRTVAASAGRTDYGIDHESDHKQDALYWRIFRQKSVAVDEATAAGSGFAISSGGVPGVHINGGGGGGGVGGIADWNGYAHSDYYFASHNESSVYSREPAFSC